MVWDSIYITDVEAEILSVFVRRMVLDDKRIVGTLEALIEKLELKRESSS